MCLGLLEAEERPIRQDAIRCQVEAVASNPRVAVVVPRDPIHPEEA